MIFLRTALLASLFLSACGIRATQSNGTQAPASVALAKVTLSYTVIASPYLPLWLAKETGIFQSNGLDVDEQLVSNSSAAMAALLSNQVDIYLGGASDTLSAVSSGADLEVIAVMEPVYPYQLFAQPAIKSVGNLKGKKIGVGSIGDSSDVAVRRVMQQAGLDPNKDVTFIGLGSPQQRAAGLINGSVDATMNNVAASPELLKSGKVVLVDLQTLKDQLPAANQAVNVRKAWLADHHQLAQQFIDSLVQAVARMNVDKTTSLGLLKTYLKTDDPAALEANYAYAREVIAALPYVRPEQFADTLDTLGKTNPKLAGFDVGAIVDNTFVQNAADRGLDKR